MGFVGCSFAGVGTVGAAKGADETTPDTLNDTWEKSVLVEGDNSTYLCSKLVYVGYLKLRNLK